MHRKEPLLAALQDYRPADEEEQSYFGAIRQILLSPRNPFDRNRFRPGHITASAFVLSPDRAKLVLLRHAKLNRWLQPGGHVEPTDASVAAAAAREVLEETGLDVGTADQIATSIPFDLDIHPIPARPDSPAHHHFDVRFLWVAKTTQLLLSEESSALDWVPISEISRRSDSESMRRVQQKLE
jgi:8-oxo-dGTP pyrophosphatase MutT (NUDIX family)